jgi:hypothetical protein
MQFGARRTVALHELSPEFNSQYHQKKKRSNGNDNKSLAIIQI